MSYQNNLISYLKVSCDTSYRLCTARGCIIDILASVLCQLFHFAQSGHVCVFLSPHQLQLSAPSLQRPYTDHHTVFMCCKRNTSLLLKLSLKYDFRNSLKRGILQRVWQPLQLTRNDDFILRINANIFHLIWPSHSVVFLPCFLLINRKILIFSSKVQMLLMTRLVVAFIHVAALLIGVSND